MQKQQGIQSIPVKPSGDKVRRIKCMFTSQLTKKRKTWSDGVLKVYYAGGCFQCSLIDSEKLRESVLCGRPLEKVEVEKLKKNEEVELEFENYLVSITAGVDYDAVGPPLKLPKFVPPRSVAPSIIEPPSQNYTAPRPSESAAFGRPYRVSADELDDIWDREQPTAPKPPRVDTAVREHHQNHPSIRNENENVSNSGRMQEAPSHLSRSVPEYPPRPVSANKHGTHTVTVISGSAYGFANQSKAHPASAAMGVSVQRHDQQTSSAPSSSGSSTSNMTPGSSSSLPTRVAANAAGTSSSSAAVGTTSFAEQWGMGRPALSLSEPRPAPAPSVVPSSNSHRPPPAPAAPEAPTTYNTRQVPPAATAAVPVHQGVVQSAAAYSTIISHSIWDD